jgi:hypothetical protein
MGKKIAITKCDMTIQRENGQRERFSCADEEEFTIKAYKYFLQIWKPKSNRMRNILLEELTGKLASFNKEYAFNICGITVSPTMHYIHQ